MLKDIFAGEGGSIYNHQIAILGDHFYFAADDGVHGMELWRSDGTPQNTMIVKDLVPGPDHAKPERLVSLDDKLYFRAFTPAYGCELWAIDGSSENYSLLTDVIPGPEYANPQSFTKLGDNLVFFADTPANGVQLWAYNEQVTGVEHTTESLVIFPNPSSGRFYVNLGSETLKDAHVEVLDLQGKAVYVNDNSFLETGIDLQPYPPGIYIVRVKFGSKNFVWKVVKV